MSLQPRQRSIAREDFIEVVDKAAEGITASTREKLLEVARTTEAVAVGWYFCGEVGCPARQARRRNQRFQTAYDFAMAERFGMKIEELGVDPFVVEITP